MIKKQWFVHCRTLREVQMIKFLLSLFYPTVHVFYDHNRNDMVLFHDSNIFYNARIETKQGFLHKEHGFTRKDISKIMDYVGKL